VSRLQVLLLLTLAGGIDLPASQVTALEVAADGAIDRFGGR
jgi:hypothetical protein